MDGTSPSRQGQLRRVDGRVLNAMTVDVEDYFQVEALSAAVPRKDWDAMPSRVEISTGRLLELFDRFHVKATFFILGWVAERHPVMIRRIVASGHELASHGVQHDRADRQTRDEFRADARRSKKILEDIGGVAVKGYRAATFSIGSSNLWTLDVLAEEGFAYSSSIYPIAHDLYGMPDAPRAPFFAGGKGLIEVPLTTLRLFGRNLPRRRRRIFPPLALCAVALEPRPRQRARGPRGVFYLHPWEIDPGQPRVPGLAFKSRFRHYLNLARMERRLERLLGDFAWGAMDEVFLGVRR